MRYKSNKKKYMIVKRNTRENTEKKKLPEAENMRDRNQTKPN